VADAPRSGGGIQVWSWGFAVGGLRLEAFGLARGANGGASATVGLQSYRVQDHRKLRVWRQAHDLAIAARRATRQFPRSGYGSLQGQIIRATESVVLTLVEGCGSATQREFARFLDMAIKSSKEVEAQFELAKDCGVLSVTVYGELTRETVSVRRQLCTLRARVLDAAKPRTPNRELPTPDLDPSSPTADSPTLDA
jgi:four helix bundle protein